MDLKYKHVVLFGPIRCCDYCRVHLNKIMLVADARPTTMVCDASQSASSNFRQCYLVHSMWTVWKRGATNWAEAFEHLLHGCVRHSGGVLHDIACPLVRCCIAVASRKNCRILVDQVRWAREKNVCIHLQQDLGTCNQDGPRREPHRNV